MGDWRVTKTYRNDVELVSFLLLERINGLNIYL